MFVQAVEFFNSKIFIRVGDPMIHSNVRYPYDVTVTRRENEGFGFVIISSLNKVGSTIGLFNVKRVNYSSLYQLLMV